MRAKHNAPSTVLQRVPPPRDPGDIVGERRRPQHSENPGTEDAEHGAALEGGTSPAADVMQLGWKTGSAAE